MKRLFFAIPLCFLIFTSCKKDKDTTTSRSELIIGTWTAVAAGADVNGDNILQDSEKDPVPEGTSLIQTYNADGTGKITVKVAGVEAKETMTTWKFINNDQTLQVDEGSKITNARVLSLSANEVSGYDEATDPHYIIIFKK